MTFHVWTSITKGARMEPSEGKCEANINNTHQSGAFQRTLTHTETHTLTRGRINYTPVMTRSREMRDGRCWSLFRLGYEAWQCHHRVIRISNSFQKCTTFPGMLLEATSLGIIFKFIFDGIWSCEEQINTLVVPIG